MRTLNVTILLAAALYVTWRMYDALSRAAEGVAEIWRRAQDDPPPMEESDDDDDLHFALWEASLR